MKQCKECIGRLSYNERYDSFYCDKCNIWQEKACGDEKCWYCKDRPQRPGNMPSFQNVKMKKS